MKKINFQRIQRYSEKSERDMEEDYADVMEITNEEVRAVFEEQNEEAIKGGIYETLLKMNAYFTI